MLWTNYCGFVILTICTVVLASEKFPSHWVDPENLEEYDRVTKSKIKLPDATRSKGWTTNRNNCGRDRDQQGQTILNYYKKIINVLVKSLNVPKDNIDGYILKLHTVVSYDQYNILTNFAENPKIDVAVLREVDDILSTIIFEGSKPSYADKMIDWLEFLLPIIKSNEFIIGVFVIILISSTSYLIHKKILAQAAISILLLNGFILSFVWTWYEMVEDEQIQIKADYMQYGVPPECNEREMNWFQRWFGSGAKDCLKHVRAQHKMENKSAWKSVTPQRVLGRMFSQTFGTAIKELVFEFVDHIPWPWNYILFPVILIFVLALLTNIAMFVFRFSMKLKILNLFTFELGAGDSSSSTSRGISDHSRVQEIHHLSNKQNAKKCVTCDCENNKTTSSNSDDDVNKNSSKKCSINNKKSSAKKHGKKSVIDDVLKEEQKPLLNETSLESNIEDGSGDKSIVCLIST